MDEKKCCETCGNTACLRMIIAIYYDECLSNGYKLWIPKVKRKEEGE